MEFKLGTEERDKGEWAGDEAMRSSVVTSRGTVTVKTNSRRELVIKGAFG